ncbi:MAG TPA: hypothetical protein VHG91_08665 [Longimicrobium sp.]|nr:hypothetical protein [Longimicrobium sp.]
MKVFLVVLAAALLPACATLRGGVGDDAERVRLWQQAHDAMSHDSFRIAAASFQRLTAEWPRTYEGHESRFFLGVLALEPRSGVDLQAAEEHLGIYLAEDSLRKTPSYHDREAETLLQLVRQLRSPCEVRARGLECDTRVVTQTVPGDPAPPAGGAAEAARLRRQLAERDATISELREELQRIRNTLAPRRPQQEE